MKTKLLLIALASGALACHDAGATTIWTEQFSGYSDGQVGAAGTGGGGSIPGWNTPQTSITLTNSLGSLDGTSLGLVASSGAMATIFGTNLNTGTYNKFDNIGTFPTTTATNIYTSFLYRFNLGTDVSTTGQYITGMNRENSGYTSTATFSWFLVAQRVGSSIQLGLARPGGTTTNYAATNLVVGQTYFIVVRQQVIPPAATPDEIDLWINPPSASFGAAEGSVPGTAATTTDGADDTSNTGPGRFWIIPSGASANIDEIRVATTWAEATPPAGQCLGAGIVSSPASVTQAEGISATFKVTASGTSPTYQWQLSTNGTSWNNISGATLSTYTTPNLWIATDANDQFRAIVNVSCGGGSSATSSVASVTLTNAILTPVGVLMDDFFGDPNNIGFNSREDAPLTSSNSLWFTWKSAESGESDSGLSAFGNANFMQGIPISGTSSLWLGYFVSNNTVVTLDIGRAIKVTLPFVLNGFSSHTNNGALRFGLFDYYDSGTNITADTSDLTGSGGRAAGVRGYMLSLDFGPTFSSSSPLSLNVRSGTSDPNLMGTTSDFTSMGSGPSGGGYSNTPAFQVGPQYTLEFTVTRTALNTVSFATTITGGGTNWTFTSTETNLAYHRFDTFAIRPNSLETSADSFNFSEFKVEVAAVQLAPQSITITSVSRSANSVSLTWNPTPAGTYPYTVWRKQNLTDATWTSIQTGVSGTSYTDTTATATTGFYRVSSP